MEKNSPFRKKRPGMPLTISLSTFISYRISVFGDEAPDSWVNRRRAWLPFQNDNELFSFIFRAGKREDDSSWFVGRSVVFARRETHLSLFPSVAMTHVSWWWWATDDNEEVKNGKKGKSPKSCTCPPLATVLLRFLVACFHVCLPHWQILSPSSSSSNQDFLIDKENSKEKKRNCVFLSPNDNEMRYNAIMLSRRPMFECPGDDVSPSSLSTPHLTIFFNCFTTDEWGKNDRNILISNLPKHDTTREKSSS